jgi:dipeptidyl aminopeptidase/acylaminoacyl peptidase
MNKIQRQYGLWNSPITPRIISQGTSVMLTDVQWDSDGETLVWHEIRSGRGVLVAATGGEAPRDLTPELSVLATVGYGGGDFCVQAGNLYFATPNGRLFRQSLAGGGPHPITPEYGSVSTPQVSPDGRWVLYVYSYERIDGLAIVDSDGKLLPQRLATGHDFYCNPRWHPNGDRVAWVSWDHPQMPWDGSVLHLATIRHDNAGCPVIADDTVIAGSRTNAVFQPEFSPDGRYILYASDETGWANLYLYDLQTGRCKALVTDCADLAVPGHGARSYAYSSDGESVYYLRSSDGKRALWSVPATGGEASRMVSPLDEYTMMEQIRISPNGADLALIATSMSAPDRIVTMDSSLHATVRRRSAPEVVLAEDLSIPQQISWKTVGGAEVYGIHYPPHSRTYRCDGLPPTVLMVHGGPTGQARVAYDTYGQWAQFLATRGYGVLLVNHRGSTGHGKQYMESLRSHWGVYDVEDSVSGAEYLAAQGLADPERHTILGGSAGGYTVLQALVTRPGFFKAGVCLFGISNLFTLAADTHKFEEHYLDSLIGPLPAASRLYRDRSPIFHANRIRDAVAVFQGEDDPVVPKSQAEAIVASLRTRGVPHEYVLYPGEGHGWAKATTIEDYAIRLEAFLRTYVLFA